jgi:hypothetical protein
MAKLQGAPPLTDVQLLHEYANHEALWLCAESLNPAVE